jgi:hypothetical protein
MIIQTLQQFEEASLRLAGSTSFVSGALTPDIVLPVITGSWRLKYAKSDSSDTVVTISAGEGNTIEGQPSISLVNQYSSVTLESDGLSTWYRM